MPVAVEKWEAALRALAVPPAILEEAPESPWVLPVELFKKRAENALAGKPPPSTPFALEALPQDGSVLDIGAGGGAASLPLAEKASRITAFDASEDMLEAFLEQAAKTGTAAEAIFGTWPEDAARAPRADVVVCYHVLYNVPSLEPFVAALNAHTGGRVVVEITGEHPLAWTGPLWRQFHGWERPQGPYSDDAEAALQELGVPVRRIDHRLERSGGFSSPDDAVASIRRRLCLPPERQPEVAEALAGTLREQDGAWMMGPSEQTVTTFWWDSGG